MKQDKYHKRNHINNADNLSALEQARLFYNEFKKLKNDTAFYVIEVRQKSVMGGYSYVMTHVKDIDYEYIGFRGVISSLQVARHKILLESRK